jgi:hypothetical protein
LFIQGPIVAPLDPRGTANYIIDGGGGPWANCTQHLPLISNLITYQMALANRIFMDSFPARMSIYH